MQNAKLCLHIHEAPSEGRLGVSGTICSLAVAPGRELLIDMLRQLLGGRVFGMEGGRHF